MSFRVCGGGGEIKCVVGGVSLSAWWWCEFSSVWWWW